MDERGDLDVLVAPMSLRRRAGTEVHGVDPGSGEVGDVRPRLLGLDSSRTRLQQPSHVRVVGHHEPRRRVAGDLDRRCLGDERAQLTFGVVRRSVGRVPEADRRDREIRDHVVRCSGREARHAEHLAERQSSDDRVARLVREDRSETRDGPLDRVVRVPRPRRMTARPREREPGRQVPEAARLDLAVGRLEEDRERGVVDRP